MALNSRSFPRQNSPMTQSPDLRAVAQDLDIDPMDLSDTELRLKIKAELERRWKLDNADLIKAYNEMVARDGLPLDQWRSF